MDTEELNPSYVQPVPTVPSPISQPKAVNWPALIAAIGFSVGTIFAGGAVAYHFLVNVPERERAEAAIRTQEIEAQNAKVAEQRLAVERAEADYQICLTTAQGDYENRWNQHCATLSAERERLYNRCVENNLGDSRYCAYVQRVPRADCQLPGDVAASYDAANELDKQRCLEARNAVLNATGSRS